MLPMPKKNLEDNYDLLCDLHLKYKTQPQNLLISFTNTYAESVFILSLSGAG